MKEGPPKEKEQLPEELEHCVESLREEFGECLPEESISRLLSNEDLPEPDRRTLLLHVELCPNCERAFQQRLDREFDSGEPATPSNWQEIDRRLCGRFLQESPHLLKGEQDPDKDEEP